MKMEIRKKGRPRKGDDKRVKLSISLAPDVLALARAEADDDGVKLSTFIERAILASKKTPRIIKIQEIASSTRAELNRLIDATRGDY